MRNRIIPCQRDAGTRLATALRRRPFSACNKGNRRRPHAGNLGTTARSYGPELWLTNRNIPLINSFGHTCTVGGLPTSAAVGHSHLWLASPAFIFSPTLLCSDSIACSPRLCKAQEGRSLKIIAVTWQGTIFIWVVFTLCWFCNI